MSFLKRFYKRLGARWWSSLLGVGPHTNGDLLARFLTSRSYFSAATGNVKSSGFMPPTDLRLSVFRITGLSSSDVWQIGRTHVARPPDRNVHARADFHTRSVSEVGLRLELDNIPPTHASVTGWPTEKSARKLCALELARRSALRIAPGTGPSVA